MLERVLVERLLVVILAGAIVLGTDEECVAESEVLNF